MILAQAIRREVHQHDGANTGGQNPATGHDARRLVHFRGWKDYLSSHGICAVIEDGGPAPGDRSFPQIRSKSERQDCQVGSIMIGGNAAVVHG